MKLFVMDESSFYFIFFSVMLHLIISLCKAKFTILAYQLNIMLNVVDISV